MQYDLSSPVRIFPSRHLLILSVSFFRVSTDKFIAQNIVIQLDHSLGRETNQKYSYLTVFMMKSTNFIKFEKQYCGVDDMEFSGVSKK